MDRDDEGRCAVAVARGSAAGTRGRWLVAAALAGATVSWSGGRAGGACQDTDIEACMTISTA